MNTDQIMALALELAGLDDIPGDSQIYHPGENIRQILFGIDIETTELWIAKQLGFDLAISHHPKGEWATLHFAEVLHRHVQQMVVAGVPQTVAEQAIAARVFEAQARAQASNYDHTPSVARLIDMPFMNIHMPLDEIGRRRMAEVVAGVDPGESAATLIASLQGALPEFHNAKTTIEIRVGYPENPIGKAAVSHGAGTNGGYTVAKAYFEHGVDTVIYIHCAPGDIERLQQEFGDKGKTLIVTGHIVSDSVGINPFIAELESRGLDVQRISGVIPG